MFVLQSTSCLAFFGFVFPRRFNTCSSNLSVYLINRLRLFSLSCEGGGGRGEFQIKFIFPSRQVLISGFVFLIQLIMSDLSNSVTQAARTSESCILN